MNKHIALLGALASLALTPVAANAATVVVPLNGPFPTHTSFTITSDPTDLTFVTSTFSATTFGKNQAFDYSFTFTLPYSGIASESFSTSFAGKKSYLDITSVLINGTPYSPVPLVATINGQSLVVGGIPITASVLNTFQIFGTTGPATTAGVLSGTVTFQASVPEPATWATFLLGFALIGFGLRRRLSTKLKFA